MTNEAISPPPLAEHPDYGKGLTMSHIARTKMLAKKGLVRTRSYKKRDELAKSKSFIDDKDVEFTSNNNADPTLRREKTADILAQPLPEGWLAFTDVKTGDPYY